MKINEQVCHNYLLDIRGTPKIKQVKDIPTHIQEYSHKINKKINSIKTNSAMKDSDLPKFGYIYKELVIMVPGGLSELKSMSKAILGALVYIAYPLQDIKTEYTKYSTEEDFLLNNVRFAQLYHSILEAYYHRILS